METTYSENYVKQLQRLLGLVRNNRKTYVEAENHIQNDNHKSLLKATISQREAIENDLRTKITALGGNPDEENEGLLDTLQRGIQGIKSRFQGHSEQSILESCRETDEVLLEGYDDVMQGTIIQDATLKTFLSEQRLVINESLTHLDNLYFGLFKSNPSV